MARAQRLGAAGNPIGGPIEVGTNIAAADIARRFADSLASAPKYSRSVSFYTRTDRIVRPSHAVASSGTSLRRGRRTMIVINDHLSIPDDEVSFVTTRSSGPGGQNVNKVESRVTLLFDTASSTLDDQQRAKIESRLANRINNDGILRVTSQIHRTQAGNRRATVEHFAELLAKALIDRPPRKRKKIPKSAHRKRLEGKKKRSEVKKGRRPVRRDD